MWWPLFAAFLCAYILAPGYIVARHALKTSYRQIFIFHPWADGGGGGEKCLWVFIKALCEKTEEELKQARRPGVSRKPLRIVLFCHQFTSHIEDLLGNVKNSFGIELPSFSASNRNRAQLTEHVCIRLVRLSTANFAIEAYPWGTQLLQLLAGVLVGTEAAVRSFGRGVLVDTTGVASTMAWFNWVTSFCRSRSYAYVHYPMINVHKPPTLHRHLYYALLRVLYTAAAKTITDPLIANSTYTEARLNTLWPNRKISKLFPPVDVDLSACRVPITDRPPTVISVAQFRKEKRHLDQLKIIQLLLNSHNIPSGTKFLICGSCRPMSEDTNLLLELADYADKRISKASVFVYCHSESASDDFRWEAKHQPRISDACIEFHINLGKDQLHRKMACAKVGMHTMVDEHLGISVAEMALCGLYVVAHNSGGPKNDVLRPVDGEPLGALCNTNEDFAAAIASGLVPSQTVIEATRRAPTIVRQRFPTDEEYGSLLLDAWNLGPKKSKVT